MRPSTARRHLPDAHRRALELRALDLESTDVAALLGIEVSAVEPLFAVATAKLAALESLQEPEDAPDPSPNARGTHR